MEANTINSDIYFDNLRKSEYSRLDKSGHVYLDYTGGNIYPQSLLEKHFNNLQNNIYGNPHSDNPTAMLSEKMVSEARRRVLDFFNASDYYCVFTANATGALKIVAESYPFSADSHFLLTADNHNSVNGIREYCKNKGGTFTYSPMDEDDLSINEVQLTKQLYAQPGKRNKLFAYPAQSNASGVQHSLSWISKAQEKGWDVLLDAAAFVPASKLDLSKVHPDFVCISFYKMFGYPTGIGCLMVRKSKMEKLKKPWFAGGTVAVSSVRHNGYFLKPDHERFEDGTVNYLDIPAITNGLDFMTAIGIENISSRIKGLSGLFLLQLDHLRHGNALPLIKLFGPKTTAGRGGSFLINFFDVHGKQYPFQYIEQLANENKISLRTGCFCNPGIDEISSNLSADQLEKYFANREYGDADDMVQFLGKRRGAVRISIGIPTTIADMEKFIRFAKTLLNRAVFENVLPALKDSNKKLQGITF